MNIEAPQDWQWAKLGEVCQVNPRRPKEFRRDDGNPTTFIPMGAVNGISGKVDEPQTRPYREVKKGYTFFADGDILFAKITPCMQNGKHFIADNLIDGAGFASTEFHVLRPDDFLLPRWVHFYLRQPSILKEAIYHFTGTAGQQRVPDSFLKNLPFPLPPLAEQKRIVAVLNEKMAAVEKARVAALERVEAVRALSSAWLRDVFSFDDGELPQGWRQSVLGDVCEKTATTDPRKNPKEHFVYIDISSIDRTQKRVMNPTEMAGENAPSRARKIVKKGDVLVATTRPNLNAVAIIPKSLDGQICSTGFCVLRSSKLIASEFLFYFVQTKVFIESVSDLVKGALYPAVTDKQIFAQQIYLPPIPEQKRLVSALNAKMATTQKALTVAQAELEAITALPSALLRKAFNGAL